MAEQLAEQSDSPDRQGANGKRKLFMLIGGVCLLLGIGAGVWFFLLSGNDDAPEVDADVAATPVRNQGPVQYLNLSPSFVVNFPYQGRQRFLQTNITIMSRDAEALLAVSEHMPVVRHNLINLFSAQLILVFEDPTGIENLRMLATQEVQEILQREIGRKGIEELLFTSFVLQ